MESTFLPAYFSTRFWVEAHERYLMEFGVIISGFATTDQVWIAQRNWQSDRDLEALRQSHLQRSLVRLIGYSPRLDHAEPSWLIDISTEDGCRIGLEFEQDALYWVEADGLFVVDCRDPGTQAYVGRFSERVDWLDTESMRKCLKGNGPLRFGT